MCGRAPSTTRDEAEERDDLARRGARLAELERSQRHLLHLYDISKLLARFHTFERTVPR